MTHDILILGDFRGREHAARPSSEALERRRIWRVDRDDLDAVLGRLSPELDLVIDPSSPPIALRFACLDDFHPDRLAERVPLLRELRELRTESAAPGGLGQSPRESAPVTRAEPTAAMLSGGSLLDDILDAGVRGGSAAERPARPTDELSEFVRRAVSAHVVPESSEQQRELIAKCDAALAASLRLILHHPDFQALEALWRGIDLLTRRLDTGEALQLHLVDVTPSELSAALANDDDPTRGGLRGLLEAGSASNDEPRWSVVVANCVFGAQDVAVIDRLTRLGEETAIAWLAAADPSLAGATSFGDGTDSDDWDATTPSGWDALRQRPAARWLSLSLPRFLARVPYGAATDPCEVVPFEEIDTERPAHEGYLWGNSAMLCALVLGESASESAPWATQGTIDGLPFHVARIDGEAVATPVAEALLSQRSMMHLLDRGLTTVVSEKDGDAVRIARLQSIANPPAPLALRQRRAP